MIPVITANTVCCLDIMVNPVISIYYLTESSQWSYKVEVMLPLSFPLCLEPLLSSSASLGREASVVCPCPHLPVQRKPWHPCAGSRATPGTISLGHPLSRERDGDQLGLRVAEEASPGPGPTPSGFLTSVPGCLVSLSLARKSPPTDLIIVHPFTHDCLSSFTHSLTDSLTHAFTRQAFTGSLPLVL